MQNPVQATSQPVTEPNPSRAARFFEQRMSQLRNYKKETRPAGVDLRKLQADFRGYNRALDRKKTQHTLKEKVS